MKPIEVSCCVDWFVLRILIWYSLEAGQPKEERCSLELLWGVDGLVCRWERPVCTVSAPLYRILRGRVKGCTWKDYSLGDGLPLLGGIYFCFKSPMYFVLVIDSVVLLYCVVRSMSVHVNCNTPHVSASECYVKLAWLESVCYARLSV